MKARERILDLITLNVGWWGSWCVSKYGIEHYNWIAVIVLGTLLRVAVADAWKESREEGR